MGIKGGSSCEVWVVGVRMGGSLWGTGLGRGYRGMGNEWGGRGALWSGESGPGLLKQE